MSEGKHNKSESRGQGDGGQWGNQKWPPFQKSDYHEDTGDAPDESDEYRKKMEAMAKRGDNYDPLDDLEGESERAQTRYHVDYHPRRAEKVIAVAQPGREWCVKRARNFHA